MKRSSIDRSVSGRGSSHTMSLDRIEMLSRTHLIQSTNNTSTLEKTDTVMNQVSDSIQALGTIANASHQSTILSLEQLSDKMQYLSGLSTGQSETINATCNAILELLKQQHPAKPLHSAAEAFQHETISPGAMNHSQEVETEGKAHINSGDDHGLQNALDRLCHFAKQKEKTAFSEEAETVIRNLQHILKLLLLDEEEERREGSKGKTHGESSERAITHNNLLYQDEVKQIKRMLGVSHCVSINEKGQYKTDLGTPTAIDAFGWHWPLSMALLPWNSIAEDLPVSSISIIQPCHGKVQSDQNGLSTPFTKRHCYDPATLQV